MIEDANFDDLRCLALNLRPEDVLELSVTRDLGKYEELAWAGATSRWRKVAIIDRQPLFAFGAAELPDESRVQVWGFGCANAIRVLQPVTRYIRRVMIPEILRSGVVEAQAISHPANRVSHRWLEFLGFKFRGALADVGVRKEEMFLFTLSANDLAGINPIAIAA